jgi:type I restriction-modification system DNA methylase subunit
MAVIQQEIDNRLWDTADELRVAMPEAQYSSVVFPLMLWKHLSDTWNTSSRSSWPTTTAQPTSLPRKATRSSTARNISSV